MIKIELTVLNVEHYSPVLSTAKDTTQLLGTPRWKITLIPGYLGIETEGDPHLVKGDTVVLTIGKKE